MTLSLAVKCAERGSKSYSDYTGAMGTIESYFQNRLLIVLNLKYRVSAVVIDPLS